VSFEALAATTLDFPERHPLLGLYRAIARALFLVGAFAVVAGIGLARFMTRFGPLTPADFVGVSSLKYWGVWLAEYGKVYGSYLLVLSFVVWLYGRIIRKGTLFGDRIRRDY
jgi:hypothetical protein